MSALRIAAALICAVGIVACAGRMPTVSSNALRLPVGGTALAGVTVDTSPDGGIYRNPDPMTVVMVRRAAGDELIAQGGAAAVGWAALLRYGDFTFIGIAVRNSGAAESDPQLNGMQIAADFAPPGTDSGPLRHFYHPMFPLALLSIEPSDQSCTLHIDPGQAQIAVLVYPPISTAPSIVWGVYDDFAIRAPFGGGLPVAPQRWQLTPCTAPQPT